jgi:CHAD domain-containing protein
VRVASNVAPAESPAIANRRRVPSYGFSLLPFFDCRATILEQAEVRRGDAGRSPPVNPAGNNRLQGKMEIVKESAQKPFRKLRKALKRLPSDPSTKDVHSLRTQTRRLEAVVDAFDLDRKKKTERLLKAVTPVRKAAGSVRDMDVLVENVLKLADYRDDSLVRLVEHLGELRVESARDLRHTVAGVRKDARRNLKDYSKLVGRQFGGDKETTTTAAPAPQEIVEELANWPALGEENIHQFRIRVKQLRYMLQLSNAVDAKTIEDLGEVKDQVGDWHDWQELARIARQVLDPKVDQAALKRIDQVSKEKLKAALDAANAVRQRYFRDGGEGAKRNGHAKRNGRK